MMDVTFTFEDDETYHDDLVLRIGDSVWRCDSYYLLIDREMLPDDEDSSKVRVVLRALLKSWRKAIEDISDGTTVYLPYDFSDECSAWLACELVKAELLIRRGWADVEGFSILPSAPPAPVTKPAGFRPDAGPWTMPVQDFLKGIDRSIAATV